MPSLIEVWDSRLGIEEIAGPKHNPIIVGWAKAIGWESIQDDETHWCAIAMCSAAMESTLPMPAHNVRPSARSWMTMGVTVAPEDAQPGDIMVEPRGNNGWSGHVSMIRHVKKDGGRILVRNIGGNQTKAGTNGAVTLTGWKDVSVALPNGIRRMVPATVKDLRPHSSTIKAEDRNEKLAIAATFFTPVTEGIKSLFEGVPNLSSVAGLTYWETMGKVASNVFNYANAHPYMVAICIVGGGLWLNSYLNKRSRVAEHQAGIPIAAEVAKLGAA